MEDEKFYIMYSQCVELSDDAAKKYLPFYYRVKTKADWNICGIKFKVDIYENPIRTELQNKPYTMIRLVSFSNEVSLAIQTGKRYLTGISILDLLRQGVPFDEFIEQPTHVKDYCLGRLAEERGQLETAKSHYLAAVQEKPDEVHYRTGLYRLRLNLEGISSIDEEVSFFANDMDSMLHSGRVDEWLKALLATKRYCRAASLIILIDRLLTETIDGKRRKVRYAGQSINFISCKRGCFRKKIASWKNSTRYRPLIAELKELGDIPLP